MKKHLFFTTFFLTVSILSSYSQSWLWSHQIGGSKQDKEYYTCIDAIGNVYTTGSFQSSEIFIGDEILHLKGYNNFYIAKYNSMGTIQWAKKFGGNNDSIQGLQGIYSMTFNNTNHNLFVTGLFGDTCIFGSDTLISNGNLDAFVAKMDTNGNIIWAKRAGGSDKDYGSSLDADFNGNVYVELILPSGGLIDTINVSNGVFFTKWNSDGKCLWAKNIFSSTSIGNFFQIRIKNNDIFAIGSCGVKTFTIDTITVNANYTRQYLIARFDTNATPKWIKSCASPTIYGKWGLDIDNGNNSYITGSFDQPAFFDNDTLFTNANADVFIAKYNSAGHVIWARQSKSSQTTVVGNGLTLGNNNDIYITGSVIGNAVFGDDTIYGVSSLGDMFVAKYDSLGIYKGLEHVVNASGSSVNVDNYGSIYVTGGFENTITFGSNSSLSSLGQWDIYVAKLNAITGGEEQLRIINNRLLIYANPTTGICNVTLPDEFQNEKQLTLKIYNNNGTLMQTVPVAMYDGKIQVNLQEEAKGIYLITLSNGAKSYSGKIIFE
jgi:hypothetical protein